MSSWNVTELRELCEDDRHQVDYFQGWYLASLILQALGVILKMAVNATSACGKKSDAYAVDDGADKKMTDAEWCRLAANCSIDTILTLFSLASLADRLNALNKHVGWQPNCGFPPFPPQEKYYSLEELYWQNPCYDGWINATYGWVVFGIFFVVVYELGKIATLTVIEVLVSDKSGGKMVLIKLGKVGIDAAFAVMFFPFECPLLFIPFNQGYGKGCFFGGPRDMFTSLEIQSGVLVGTTILSGLLFLFVTACSHLTAGASAAGIVLGFYGFFCLINGTLLYLQVAPWKTHVVFSTLLTTRASFIPQCVEFLTSGIASLIRICKKK